MGDARASQMVVEMESVMVAMTVDMKVEWKAET